MDWLSPRASGNEGASSYWPSIPAFLAEYNQNAVNLPFPALVSPGDNYQPVGRNIRENR